MEDMAAYPRNIVVAVDAGDACLSAVHYAVRELIRPGDVLHVCHVAAVLPPSTSITHVAPQTTYDVPGQDNDPQQLADKVQAFVTAKFVRDAETCKIPCRPHVYLAAVEASAADIAAHICSTCEEVSADMLVVAYREQDHTLWAKLGQTSVLKAILTESRTPLMVVKQYTPGQPDDLAAAAAAPAGCGADSAADRPAGS
ncbi:hypothetical protein COO60DRAFT_1497534 [Scenedesmus sp. NREL 46B-D3]|nr:hypothetical protein COO60DRAFT_1497534 [Scenedesmus sp. NREL 46B-D3]